MALTRIEYGSLASSETMNNNFDYLDNKISEVSERITTSSASIYSSIASLNTQISNQIEGVEESLQEMVESQAASAEANFSTNGLYITTYVNGTSWYREYFSDAEKTTRVWLEQGGVSGNRTTVNLLKSYSNTNYTILTCVRNGTTWAGGGELVIHTGSVSTSSFYSEIRGYDSTSPNLSWYTCGV